MKLPENYQNWIEFAKECDKYPAARDITCHYHGNVENFNINAVKAKAFDEVMELAIAAKKEVSSLKTSLSTDMAIMTRFLILLTNGSN